MGAAVPATISRSEVGHRNGGAPCARGPSCSRTGPGARRWGLRFCSPLKETTRRALQERLPARRRLLRLCGPGLCSRTSPEVKVALPGPAVVYPTAGCARQHLAGCWCLPLVDLFGPVLPRGTNTVLSP